MTRRNRPSRPPAPARGFSLVEILIAILVLGFGLLGLAAVFPVVISQQRNAANEMRGPSAVESVKAQLRGSTSLVNWADVAERADPQLLPTQQPPAGIGRWIFDRGSQGGLAKGQRTIDVYPTGWIEFIGNTGTRYEIPATARVFPSPYGSVSPQFVWDVAVRRRGSDQPLEAAIFIRRIDTGIVVPRGKTLANVLTGEGLSPGGAIEPAAVPVGDTPEGEADDDRRRPSGNGTGDYSRLRELFVRPEHAGQDRDLPIDRFPMPTGVSKLTETLVGREGQLLLDDLGVVRTVRGVESDASGERYVVVSPAFPTTEERSVVYTPQIPVAIEIISLEAK